MAWQRQQQAEFVRNGLAGILATLKHLLNCQLAGESIRAGCADYDCVGCVARVVHAAAGKSVVPEFRRP